jgi:ABC-type polysaccharide transport system permease subunit
MGISLGKFEYSTIVGVFKSAVNCVLLFTVNWVAGKISDSSPL